MSTGGDYNDCRRHRSHRCYIFCAMCIFVTLSGFLADAQAHVIDITFGQDDNRLEGQANFEGHKFFHKADGHRSTHSYHIISYHLGQLGHFFIFFNIVPNVTFYCDIHNYMEN